MSNVNIKRAVENIRMGTTAYTPIIETIVNAIQAIEEKSEADGRVIVTVERSAQVTLDGALAEIHHFTIDDNGVGFNEDHRQSFDTLYSDLKLQQGGKGFGRFTCLKYFEDMKVESVFLDGEEYKKRTFAMGKENDIIVNEDIVETDATETGTIVRLEGYKKNGFQDKKLLTIARNLVEKLLPYFIMTGYSCPQIIIKEQIGKDRFVLNDLVNNEASSNITEMNVSGGNFTLGQSDSSQSFEARIFKIYAPKSQKSKISLVAHKREATETPIHQYIPEFFEEFYDPNELDDDGNGRNYIIKAYVFGSYLDDHVSLERGGFEFAKNTDLFYGIGQSEIEKYASKIAGEAIGTSITARQEKKREKVQSYVEKEAPWHKKVLKNIDLSSLPYNASEEEIEARLHQEKFKQEQAVKREVREVLENDDPQQIKENAAKIVQTLSDTSQNDLIHYVALRRSVLDVFEKSLSLNDDAKYDTEGMVHDIIFPQRRNSDNTEYEEHNLWIIDERLNFTDFVASDIPLDGGNTERPDLLAFHKRAAFRGENSASNPVTIFEFKRPGREDFVNPSSKEDPIEQIVRYVNNIRDGKYKTPQGRPIQVEDNTPFYGYVICDITAKVEKWLDREKMFKPMPDKLGWFQWMDNINLYVEVISWDKLLADAKMRNKRFFHELGI